MIRYAWLDSKCDFLMNKMKKYSDKKGIEYNIQLAKVIDSLPVNHFEGMNRKMILERDGYVKNHKDGDKRVLFKNDFLPGNCMMYVHISEIDDSRPWTIIDDGEYGLILYLDNFEKVNEKYNYYKYKDEYYGL